MFTIKETYEITCDNETERLECYFFLRERYPIANAAGYDIVTFGHSNKIVLTRLYAGWTIPYNQNPP